MINNLSFLSTVLDKRVLIAPLNWGLGHASRCVPIINELKNTNEVILASDGLANKWLKREFPNLVVTDLPSYEIKYGQGQMWIAALQQLPHIIKTIDRERHAVKSLIEKKQIDLIISDHRLGVRGKNVRSVLLAHQLFIPHKNRIVSFFVSHFHRSLINNFDECWIPDDEKSTLSGKMSQLPLEIPKRFIGPLSRLKRPVEQKRIYDAVVILSGPEPQRSNLEKSVLTCLRPLQSLRFAIIRGTDKRMPIGPYANTDVIQIANSQQLNTLVNTASTVICRPGYSSIMDLMHLGKKAILIPTPNQPEQEYLAKHVSTYKDFVLLHQNDLNTRNLRTNIVKFQKDYLNKSGIL